MFTDQVEIQVKSGKGGDGMVHFRREKFIPFGGPDGGDGGKGADIYLEAVAGINTLADFRYHRAFRAPHGTAGSGNAQVNVLESILVDIDHRHPVDPRGSSQSGLHGNILKFPVTFIEI